MFQETPSSFQDVIPEKMAIYCAGVVFNTAIKTGTSANLDRRAAMLYETSLQLIGQHVDAYSNNTASLIAMAASNNLAQIELEKGLVEQACKRLQALKFPMQSLRSVVPHIFTVHEFQCMLSNTLSTEGVTVSPAA
ncbi:unnamed protein product [Cylindrotheca closterium]|uniref:Uncharacterized protein n=1 Tax=Cylindrotheca closterium TaxID=2856 RepID=A0AAD2FP88_9STRA|nr:unnamed protein product [Cylindrotheca closterium]